MPIFDLVCENGHKQYDLYLGVGERPPCPECGSKTEMLWEASSNVIQDNIEGGIEIRHGLCWPDGTPRKFYSRSEIAKVAKEKGLVNAVEHKTSPDTDKSKHTSRWV